MSIYKIDVTSWDDFVTLTLTAPDKESAFRAAHKVAQKRTPGYDVVRLWGEGRILWTCDEGWREEDAISSETVR